MAEGSDQESWPSIAQTLDTVPDKTDLLFADIPTLAALIRSRQVSCRELTELYLERLAAEGVPLLHVGRYAAAQRGPVDLVLRRAYEN